MAQTFNSIEEELNYWKSYAQRVTEEKDSIQREYEDYTADSQQLEKEYEITIDQHERTIREIKSLNNSLQNKVESLQVKLDQSNKDNDVLQSDISSLQEGRETLRQYIRELEQKNDDLERAQRVVTETVAAIETSLNSALERNAILESEIDEKEGLKERLQRLADETRVGKILVFKSYIPYAPFYLKLEAKSEIERIQVQCAQGVEEIAFWADLDLRIATVLAGNDDKQKKKILKNLRTWLHERSLQMPLTDHELARVWKTLLYAVWTLEDSLNQIDHIEKIAEVLHFSRPETCLHFLKFGFNVLSIKWSRISQSHLDTFLIFTRQILRQTFMLIENCNWNVEVIQKFNNVLLETVLSNDNTTYLGLTRHLSEIFLEELSSVSKYNLEEKVFLEFIKLFIKFISVSTDELLITHICKYVFNPLLNRGEVESKKFKFNPTQIIKLLKEVKGSSDLNTKRMIKALIVNFKRFKNGDSSENLHCITNDECKDSIIEPAVEKLNHNKENRKEKRKQKSVSSDCEPKIKAKKKNEVITMNSEKSKIKKNSRRSFSNCKILQNILVKRGERDD